LAEKRETDLINLGIIKKTEQIFPEETVILRASTNLMRRLTKCSQNALPYFDNQPNLRAIMELFCRNRELAHFSIVCMVNAGYAETKILSRVGTENFLLMRLFKMTPELASGWLFNPDQFRKEWKPEKIRKEVFKAKPERKTNYDQFYWLLCDYTHPSFKGWYEIFKAVDNQICIGSRPEFNSEYVSECLGLICFCIIQSVKVYVDAFKPWMDERIVEEVNRLMSKLFELITRHFEVRSYDKKKLLEKRS
jgi:hypothetical protein